MRLTINRTATLDRYILKAIPEDQCILVKCLPLFCRIDGCPWLNVESHVTTQMNRAGRVLTRSEAHDTSPRLNAGFEVLPEMWLGRFLPSDSSPISCRYERFGELKGISFLDLSQAPGARFELCGLFQKLIPTSSHGLKSRS